MPYSHKSDRPNVCKETAFLHDTRGWNVTCKATGAITPYDPDRLFRSLKHALKMSEFTLDDSTAVRSDKDLEDIATSVAIQVTRDLFVLSIRKHLTDKTFSTLTLANSIIKNLFNQNEIEAAKYMTLKCFDLSSKNTIEKKL